MSGAKIITLKVMGSKVKVLEGTTASTVQDVINEIGLDGKYTANVNGRPAEMSTRLDSGAFVVLSPAVKGA